MTKRFFICYLLGECDFGIALWSLCGRFSLWPFWMYPVDDTHGTGLSELLATTSVLVALRVEELIDKARLSRAWINDNTD